MSTRLVIAFVGVIIITTIVAGLPAYWLIRTQLEQQAWARVADGGSASLSLISAEQTRLVNMVMLVTQRPTLQTLLYTEDRSALSEYLRTFQSGTELDVFMVRDQSGQALIGGSLLTYCPDIPLVVTHTFCYEPGLKPKLNMITSQPVFYADSEQLLGYVTLGIQLDDSFTERLAAETGLGQSLLVEDMRIATSLGYASLPDNQAPIEPIADSHQSQFAPMIYLGNHYYTNVLPIRDDQDQIVVLIEVALPVEGKIATENQALLMLVLSTLLIATSSSLISGIQARRLIAPLHQLTVSALKISQGDLSEPIPTPENPVEIATLAAAFEQSRVNTRHFLDALSRAKTWSETLIQSITEGIITFNDQGDITFFSQGAVRIMGVTSDEVLFRPLNQVFRLVEGQGTFVDYLPPYGGKSQITVFTQGECPTTLAVTRANLTPPDSEPSQIALVLRDITEEQAVRHLRAYFLANISHEFRTPLSALNASIELLLDEVDRLSLEEIEELLNAIYLSANGLQTLIDNLLESTSIEAGRFKIQRRSTDLDEVIMEALRVMKPLLDRRQQHLQLNHPAQLPPILIDPIRLTQVLVNLLSNASKYSPMQTTIDLCLEPIADHQLRVAVADQGPGISLSDRNRIFDRFVRLGKSDTTQYGMGLGLWVVKAIVEAHGGQIGIDDRPDNGSIFWFTLPFGD